MTTTCEKNDGAEVKCPSCQECFSDGLAPVVFTACEGCQVVYCRECLERYLKSHASQCMICRKKVRLTRSVRPIACGKSQLQRLRAMAAPEVEVQRVEPAKNELRNFAHDVRLRANRDRDEDRLSLAVAKSLAGEAVDLPEDLKDYVATLKEDSVPLSRDPDIEATNKLIAELTQEDKPDDETLRLLRDLEEEDRRARRALQQAKEDSDIAKQLTEKKQTTRKVISVGPEPTTKRRRTKGPQ